MAALDFPSSPTPGTIYPAAPVAGVPQYTWDGEKWVTGVANLTPVIPTGTVMLFYQAAAPTGWTKLAAQNDKALRVVSGTGGVAGGTNAFSTVMAQTVVGNHTLTVAQLAAHDHDARSSLIGANGSGTYTGSNVATGTIITGAAGSNAVHGHSITMNMQYIDLILASKD